MNARGPRVNRRVGRAATVALSLAALAACAEPGGDPLDVGTAIGSAELGRAFDQIVPELMDQHGIPGVGVALVEGGRVVYVRGFGHADAGSIPVDPSRTVFQVASISKSLVAWGALRLAETGRLDLDAPVESILERWTIPASGYDPSGVTTRRLLSHTAGMSPYGYPGFHPTRELPSLEEHLNGNSNGAGRVELALPPGSLWSYSGGGYTVVQLLIEEVTGGTFSDYMHDEVLTPLGMARSSYEWSPDLRDATATGFTGDGVPYPNFLFTAKAAGGLYSTVDDIARFVEASMSGPAGEPPGRGVISAEAVREAQSVVDPAPFYGLGHNVYRLTDGSPVVGHAGFNQGWRSFWIAAPERGIGLVVLSNSDHPFDLPARLACTWAAAVAGSPLLAPSGIPGCT